MQVVVEYILYFFLFSFIGWAIEVSRQFIQKHCFVNRGFLVGPCCSIYGYGTILTALLLYKYQNDFFVLFVMSMVTCSVLEYVTSWLMEKIFNARWWDYSSEKFNLNGRVCLKNSILFGLAGTILVSVVNPLIFQFFRTINYKIKLIVAIVLIFVYTIDNIFSFVVIFKLRNGIRQFQGKDNTEEIAFKIRDIISKSLFRRRLDHAYPIFGKTLNELKKQMNKKRRYLEKKSERITTKSEKKKQKIELKIKKIDEKEEEKLRKSKNR